MDAVWQQADLPVANLVFAHGAGAGIDHATMRELAQSFADVGLSSLRFNFPFMQRGSRRVDTPAVAVEAIACAAADVRASSELPLFLCGHSFGGRMCSHAVADAVVDCAGLIFCSFPLHIAKKPSVQRASHLPNIHRPMLFLSGTRDDLAQSDLLDKVVAALPPAQLHWLDTANHSYVILKRTRTNTTPVFVEMAVRVRQFVDEVLVGRAGASGHFSGHPISRPAC